MAERSGTGKYRVLNRLYEPGIERIYPYTKAGFAVVGAAKDRTPADEFFLLERMKWQVFRLGLRHIELDGVWVNEYKAPCEAVHEPVLFVPCPGEEWGSWERFREIMAETAGDFRQQGIVISDGNSMQLLWVEDGIEDRIQELGVFEPERLGSAYARVSRLRELGGIFTFAGVRVPGSAMEALALQKSGNLVAEGRVFFRVR
ncbi:MAG: hypothetical protein ABIK38_01085 [candidate division WOR-3 bacterium]